MAVPDAAVLSVRFCSYSIPYVGRSTIGLLSNSYASCLNTNTHIVIFHGIKLISCSVTRYLGSGTVTWPLGGDNNSVGIQLTNTPGQL